MHLNTLRFGLGGYTLVNVPICLLKALADIHVNLRALRKGFGGFTIDNISIAGDESGEINDVATLSCLGTLDLKG